MFSIIRSNQRKSVILIVTLAVVLAAFGYSLGYLAHPTAGPVGLAAALVVWAVMMGLSLGNGEELLLKQAGARQVRRQDAPRLFNLVEEMQLASGLGVPPRVYLIDSASANAFAVGRHEGRAAIAVTTGLMARLNRDELQGVIAHEIAHIRNRDTLFMTLAGTTLGAIVMLADFYLRGVRFSNIRSRGRGGGQGAAVVALAALLLAVLAPLLAQLLYFACSRRREYLADACAAQFTRYPEGLASALEKIALQPAPAEPMNRVLAPLYIATPRAARGGGPGLFSTHPPTRDRIRVLRGMAGGSSLAAYEQAYREHHRNRGVLGALLAASDEQGVRAASAEPAEPSLGPAWRQAFGALHNAENLHRIDCSCGARLRFPRDPRQGAVLCPRCGRVHKLETQAPAG